MLVGEVHCGTDDRGREVSSGPARWRRALSGDEPNDGPLGRLAWIAARHAREEGSWLSTFVGAGFFWCLTAGPVFAVAHLQGWTLPNWSWPAWFGAVWVVVRHLLVRGAMSRRIDAIIGVFLAWGRCPSCGHLMERGRVEPDGCCVCSECGAAWRADRVGGPMTSDPCGRVVVGWIAVCSDWIDRRMLACTTIDASGKVVSLTSCSLRGLRRACVREIGKDRLFNAWRLAFERSWGVGKTLGLLALCVMSVAMCFGVVAIARGALARGPIPTGLAIDWAWYTVLSAAVTTLTLGLLVGLIGVRRRSNVGTLLEFGICPSCAADLAARGEHVEGSGHVRCPDCRAEWAEVGK